MTSLNVFALALSFSNNTPFCLLDLGDSPGDVSEELVTKENRNKGWRMNCDVGEATEGLENEL